MKIKSILFGIVLALLVVASPCIADVVNEIDSNFDSDSIRFYFSDIIFGYQNVNYMYDFGEVYEDYGIDQCTNNLETGDSLLVEFISEDFCFCGIGLLHIYSKYL